MNKIDLSDEVIKSIVTLNVDLECKREVIKTLKYLLNKNFNFIFNKTNFINLSCSECNGEIDIKDCLFIEKVCNDKIIIFTLNYFGKEYNIYVVRNDMKYGFGDLKNDDSLNTIMMFDQYNRKIFELNFMNKYIENSMYIDDEIITYSVKNNIGFDNVVSNLEETSFGLTKKDSNKTCVKQLRYLESVNRIILYEMVSAEYSNILENEFNTPSIIIGNHTCNVSLLLTDGSDNAFEHLDYIFNLLKDVYDPRIILKM